MKSLFVILAFATASVQGGPQTGLRELVPGVRVGAGVVEFNGTVCADASHPQTPVVYLELLVTGPNTREHESLVVTTVKPSAIHAGLLAAGFEHGSPVRIEHGTRMHATGDAVRVLVAPIESGKSGRFVPLSDWVVGVQDPEDAGGTEPQRLADADGWGLVFAGSLLKDDGYAADQTGTIVGLTGFGTEVIAASWLLSPWAAQDEPEWIVDADRVGAFGTDVIIRLEAIPNSENDPTTQDEKEASVTDDPDAPSP